MIPLVYASSYVPPTAPSVSALSVVLPVSFDYRCRRRLLAVSLSSTSPSGQRSAYIILLMQPNSFVLRVKPTAHTIEVNFKVAPTIEFVMRSPELLSSCYLNVHINRGKMSTLARLTSRPVVLHTGNHSESSFSGYYIFFCLVAHRTQTKTLP